MKKKIPSIDRGTSPRVSKVLRTISSRGDWSYASLAEATGLSTGTMNQLFLGKTKSTPRFIGRLCAVLERDDAQALLAAYLTEVADAVWANHGELLKSRSAATKEHRRVEISYPPAAEDGAA